MYRLFLLTLLFTGFKLYAQHNYELYNNGEVLFIDAGAEVYVLGDMHMQGGTLTNNGLIQVEGNLFSDATFQQRGTGITRLHNGNVNTTERQYISGSYAVRGGQSAIGVDDGSFYHLQLANTQGVVYLLGTGNIADVRGSVNFDPAGVTAPVNNLVTHDVGLTGPVTYPSNGSDYAATFGMMNNTTGLGNFLNNTVSINGNSSSVDNGYVIGKLRRAIHPAGGTYGYPMGLEPAALGAARGIQYSHLTCTANTYDVVTGYFQQGASNDPGAPFPECSGYSINYFGGIDHGEWMYADAASGSGTYSIQVWPQDDNFSLQGVWMITRNDVADGTADQCSGTPVGAERGGFTNIVSSAFGIAGGTNLLSNDHITLQAVPLSTTIGLEWHFSGNEEVIGFSIERSEDGMSYIPLHWIEVNGPATTPHYYTDTDVLPGISYFYRITAIVQGGLELYSNIDEAMVLPSLAGWSAQVQPNPANTMASLVLSTSHQQELHISVFNALGQPVWHQNLVTESDTHVALPTSRWASGYYVVVVTSATAQQSLRLLVAH